MLIYHYKAFYAHDASMKGTPEKKLNLSLKVPESVIQRLDNLALLVPVG